MVSGTQNNLHPPFELPLLSELFTYFFENSTKRLHINGKLFTGDETTLGADLLALAGRVIPSGGTTYVILKHFRSPT